MLQEQPVAFSLRRNSFRRRSPRSNVDDRGWTPLHIKARKGDLKSVKQLLDQGMDVNALAWGPKSKGVTPLCVLKGALEARLGERRTEAKGESPRIAGARLCLKGEPERAPSLGASLSLKRACEEERCFSGLKGAPRPAPRLEAQGHHLSASVRLAPFKTQTPLHLAAEGGHIEVMDLLLERGANIDARTWGSCGWTPLHAAAKERKREAVKFLVENGAFLPDDISDTRFNPPVHYCHGLEWAYEEMKKLSGESSSSGGDTSCSSQF